MSSQLSIDTHPASGATPRWRDIRLSPAERAEALIAADDAGGEDRPTGRGVGRRRRHRESPSPRTRRTWAAACVWDEVIKHGLGQLTRPFGTAPVDPVAGARALAAAQAQIVAASRFGIPAQVHEECLTGFAAWGATVYPAPLSWGATFDPELVEQMAGRIGGRMRAAGVHQGLAPVLDVTRDYRWGRTEETIGEDPYLVGTVGAAYVRGLEQAGVVATLKHFAGYSASRGGRNLAPVPIGPAGIRRRHPAAVRDGAAAGRRAVGDALLRRDRRGAGRRRREPADRVAARPAGASPARWSPTTSPSGSCRACTGSPPTGATAAGLALRAGIDVELPTVDAFGAPLVEAVRAGAIDEALVDRALRRVLAQKAELGLLDADPQHLPDGVDDLRLDDEASQDLALRLARESVVLLRNAGVLPLAAGARVALIGPVADDPLAMLGCYSFPVHVGPHPEHGYGVPVPSLRTALTELIPDLSYEPGCAITGADTADIAAAVAAAADSRRVRARGRRPGRTVRPGHLRRGLRRRRPAPARSPGRPGRRGAAHRYPGGAGAARRPAVRAGSAGGRRRGRRLRLLPRPGRRAGAGRGADRRGQPVRAAAGERAPRLGRAAGHLPLPTAGPAQPGLLGRPDARRSRSATG